ncbi:Elongation factor 2 [Glycine soja]|uniref:Elongation factor 2 n=1 Tax=Glycine soja TaxID=3848 RepID=A0A445GYC2_GLYSO|nr:Elongation factor 2 [Glycine soja]
MLRQSGHHVQVKFTVDELRQIMDRNHNNRNMSVIAHVEHGKSTLIDSLVAAAGIIAQETAGDVRMTDTLQYEAERGITIKSIGISLYYKMQEGDLKSFKGDCKENDFLINLIDSPGHVDFSSEVTAALHVTDGALVVVDCVEGVRVQTETVLRQALGERVKPVLVVNKMDRFFCWLAWMGLYTHQLCRDWTNKHTGVNLKSEEKELTGKALMKHVMQSWAPASSALLEMMIYHLPSPARAQQYRVENLYEGPLDDQYATAIRNCDPEGPLMLYVSKMIPASDKGRFFSFGRVFSGKVSTGLKKQETVEEVLCGNTVAMVGLDHFITNNATLTNEKEVDAHPIRAMKFSVSPVVSVAVTTRVPSDLPKLEEGLKRLAKSNPMVVCTLPETGEHIISAAGKLHLEICLKDLQDDFMNGAEISISDPILSFRETVLERSCHTVMSKSPNKHNRLYMEARPMEAGLAEAIDDEKIGPGVDPKNRSKILSEELGWDKDLALAPMVKDPTWWWILARAYSTSMKSKTQLLLGLREHQLEVQWLRGGQIISTARRACYAAMLTAKPRLLEPVYLVEIQAPEQALGGVYSVLNQKRGHVFEESQRPGTPLYNVKAYFPVIESSKFNESLRAKTGRKAFPQLVFDHWDMVPSDPLEPGTPAAALVAKIRRKKSFDVEMRPFFEFEDRL